MDRLRFKTGPRRADVPFMRIVLEWLGLVEPQRARREPVALPAWAPFALAMSVTGAIYLVSLALRALFL
jgi:hypothetical protein